MNMPTYKVAIRVEATDDYAVVIEFEDGEKRLLDMSPYLDFERFREIKSRKRFKDVRISFDTIEWGNGLDLDPEFIHEKSTILKDT